MAFRGRLMNRRLPGRLLTATVLGITLALTGSAVQAASPAPGQEGRGRPGVQDFGDPAEGRNAQAKKRPADEARKAAVKRLDKAVWPAGGSAKVAVATTSPVEENVGGLPVAVTAVTPEATKTSKGAKASKIPAPSAGPAEVEVAVLPAKRAAAIGAGALMRVERTDAAAKGAKVRLSVDYSKFADAYGGDYAARLQLVQLPACAAVATPGSKACPEQAKPLATVNNAEDRTVSADVQAAAAPAAMTAKAAPSAAPLVALAAGPSSAQGSYKATALAPSASWSVANSSGGFSWSYPLRTVPTPGGQTPSIGLGYSSQSADGRTSVTNNQGSWVGEGFSYDPGYIERRYKPCSDDGHSTSGEQCWAFDNATIMLNGSSSELIKDDTTGDWKFSSDDGAKVERLTGATNGDNDGEHWKVTTADGTEYWFGLNRLPGWTDGKETTDSTWTVPVFGDDSGEPCYNATFTSAHCKQAWRWSLDHVKDTHGNVMSYFYAPETNYYALNGKTDVNGTAYHRGGYLKRVDYGQRDGQVYAAKAPARAVFDVAERCLPTDDFDCAESKRTKANAAHWPDTPVDQECKAATKCTVGQTFWTTKRLTGITTQMRKSATEYQDVDAWTFTHLFTDNGDDSKTLWLSKIDHEGRVGTAAKLPTLELYGEQLVNRVDAIGDNIAPFHRFRLAAVLSETGAQLDVNYAATDCTKAALPKPGESTKRCYPVKWAPPGTVEPITDWFHKYVVAEIVETDRTGGGDSLVTRYDYQGDAAWRKAEPDGITEDKYLTWGGWQGYAKVKVTSGSADKQTSRIDYTYLQGMDGDKDPDGGTRSVKVKDSTGVEYTSSKEFTGHQLEAHTYDGTKLVSKVISEPWKHYTATQTRDWGTSHSVLVRSDTERGYSLLSDGTWRATKSSIKYDTSNGTGRVLEVEDQGDVSTAVDDTCTRTWYTDNTAANLLNLPSRSEAVGVKCSVTPDRRTQVHADERTSYDSKAFGAAPTKGDATTTERLTSHNGTTGTYQVTGTTTYDAFGRPLSQKDASLAETKTAYTDVNGLISQTKSTNALNHVTTTDYAPAWGMSAGQTDPNGKRTDLAYDGLGRLTSVWLPDRVKTQTPSIKYSYNVRRDKVVAIKTEKIENDGSYGAEYQLYDGLLRPRQLQTEGPGGTRMVADSFYDGTGKVKKTNATYNAAGAASDELLIVHNGEVGQQSVMEYDGLGRATAQIMAVSGVEQWRTTNTYDGERTTVDPPKGGVPTTTITDFAGNTKEIWHYRGDSPNPLSGYDVTKYTYTPKNELQTVTDAKNNVWRYEYDQLGRKTKSVDPDAGTTTTAYDPLDHVVSSTDDRNKTVSTVYDKLGRTLTTWQGEPTTGVRLTESRYDKAGLLGQEWARISYISPTESFGTVVQTMDDFYRPLKTNYVVPASQGALAGTYSFTSAYNRDGTLQSTGVPAAGDLAEEVLVSGYDELQRPTTLTGSTSYVTDTVYSKLGHVQQLELSTGSGRKVWQTFDYETGTDRLTRSVVDVNGATAPAKESNYSYDQAGNVLSISDTANSAKPDVQCFAYDARKRLADAWSPASTAADAGGNGTTGSVAPVEGSGPKACQAAPGAGPLGGPSPYWKSYVTDAIGNRTSDTVHDTALDTTKNITRTYTYGEAGALGDGPHQVTKVVENTPTGDRQSSYEYDAIGNTTKRTLGGDAQVLEWTDTGKLAKAKEADGSETSYLYDSAGNRVQRKAPSGTTVYLPGMELQLSADGTRTEATRYYSQAGQTVAVRTNDNKVSFLASDHHGTGELAVDAASGAISQRRFDPFGVERGEATGSWPGEKGFVGGTIDASTGLTHLGAREYDAAIGKFISVDPVIDYTQPQQINGYAYANNTPVTHADPSGMAIPECLQGLIECQGGLPVSKPGSTFNEEKAVDQASGALAGAQGQQSAAKQRIKSSAKALVKIARDILGVDAALDCVSSGDMGACGETLLNIAGSFAGGLAGKIVAKYGAPWNWAKGAKLAKRVVGLVGDLIGGVKDLWKSSKAVGKAQDGLAKAKDALAAAKKKAASRKKTEGDSCLTEENHSFLPGTKVLLADGTSKAIEAVELGDAITVTDPETGETTVRQVVGTIVTEDDKHFVDLTILGGTGSPESLVSTTTHPFWVVSESKWVDAGELRPGMTLRTADGSTVTLQATRSFEERQRTHDLTVEGIHTYYVLADTTSLLVHNCNTNTVYRNLRPDEDPSQGLVAKNPDATYKPAGHVLHGSKPNWRSQFISTTRSREVAMESQWSGPRTVAIDLGKLDSSQIFDISDDAGRALHNIRGFTAINRTKSSKEVLITGVIPPEAITWVKGGP
ncbi:polymorphic toxin-type HINT domain-containing protein [Streptomyces sp. NBC_00059]|uniref:polymorphic toxin-type HINT domain-containing protein n=1 Tax=Streptomyces sp. NBC_00059 TaxID=2975635 RepID=UPI002253AFF2|nr:polymorphic toxin-type HINT domain-containing protein [Streptomyces sp. NBC_00059]MCX5417315.1 polymorphic toxin-type HINT domain-containing protein [Streptomyces sp. NBC_00059]